MNEELLNYHYPAIGANALGQDKCDIDYETHTNHFDALYSKCSWRRSLARCMAALARISPRFSSSCDDISKDCNRYVRYLSFKIFKMCFSVTQYLFTFQRC